MKHLVCINDKWIRHPDMAPGPAPKRGEIVKLVSVAQDDDHFIILNEPYLFDSAGKRQAFHENCFREVDSSFGQYCEDIWLSIAQFEEAMKEVSI